jgi:hypothetical protein
VAGLEVPELVFVGLALGASHCAFAEVDPLKPMKTKSASEKNPMRKLRLLLMEVFSLSFESYNTLPQAWPDPPRLYLSQRLAAGRASHDT